jgi:glycosyltransferase involved in cell wall biosynthesis
MLRIFVSALQVGPGMTGIGTYSRELIRGFSRIPRREEILVGAPHPELFQFLEGVDGFEVAPIDLRAHTARARVAAIHTLVPAAAQRLRADVVLVPTFVAPAWGRFQTAVAVQDLTFRRFPETLGAAKRMYYQMLVRRSVRRAARVFVTTRVIGDELVEFVPEVADRIRLTPLGVSPTFLANGDRDGEDGPTLVERPRRDFLFVGTLEPRKNLERLLTAHGNACRSDPSFPTLRVVGGRGWVDEGIHRALAAHPDPRRVVRLGYTSVEDLVAEYDQALALVFPSLYEGFGLPILEAMARGCPVVTSRGIATEEVAGGAAWLVDPLDTGDLERCLHRLAADSKLRRRLAREGRARVREFSWTGCARLTLEGLRELAPALQ